MLSVYDVAKAFLYMEPMTPKRLQKLCYYAQAWYLALYDRRLFNSEFQAWIHGLVCPELYHEYKGYGFNDIPGQKKLPGSINGDIYKFLCAVYNSYGSLTGDQLEELTHGEEPWIKARGNLKSWMVSKEPIDDRVIKAYYRKLLKKS